jgi:hypothetical protein
MLCGCPDGVLTNVSIMPHPLSAPFRLGPALVQQPPGGPGTPGPTAG